MLFDYVPMGTEYAADILARSTGKFFVYGDPDVDGVFSTFFVCRFLKAFGKEYETYINENRAHGFYYDDIESLEGRTVIAVDFSISDSALELLRQHNVKLINIDHHAIKSEVLKTYSCSGSSIDGVVINNQYCFEREDERYLSGAGMVYFVLSNLSPNFDMPLTKALVGLTLLSDIRPIENKEAEAFLRTCYTCKEPYMRYLIEVTRSERDYTFGVPSMERNYIDYTFSPKLNALFRLNLGQVALDLVMGTKPSFNLDEARIVQNQIRDYIKQHVTSPFSLNQLLGSATDGVKYTAGVPELTHLNVFYMNDMNISDTYKLANFIGLTCSQMKGFGSSVIAYIGTSEYLEKGSFRGRYDRVDYLGLFKKYGFDGHADGHANAFGLFECNLSEINWLGLNAELGAIEAEAAETEYVNRVVESENFSFFIHSDILKTLAMTNIYVRDSHRVYVKYTGSNVQRRKVGKMWEFSIDGVKVKCFDEGINTDNGYILPIYDRQNLTFYLKNIKL